VNVRRECITAGFALLLATLPCALQAAADPESCRVVRFSDIGWTDVTATTGLTSQLVRILG
jgi:glycine betaine/proline transport system substrate-binding protein